MLRIILIYIIYYNIYFLLILFISFYFLLFTVFDELYFNSLVMCYLNVLTSFNFRIFFSGGRGGNGP